MEYTSKVKNEFRERLKKIIAKKIETVMIYPLSQFEAAFGHLWGNGLPDDKLTDEQLVLKKKWKECRNNVLNNGNQQKRNAWAELDMHDIIWQRHQATFFVPQQDNK